ncbi:MAG: cell division ATPase MinD [Nanoarchaeota archaeon]|nr:cell division ATPase MinD [Nanoarchaeota archaeon]MBU1135301.1 cell division ATPase MinD [Nanoarchaeota archaeon]MBU2519763.1 cell division ATPase MinD [Nanoarchaeota archaeon]
MTRIVCVASGKGGVGKTTVVSNVATALTELDQNVVVIDSNMHTSNLGLHLGIPLYPITLQDVLKGKAKIKDALYHHPNGFRVVPADISLAKRMTVKPKQLMSVIYKLIGDADFILIDAMAGLGQEAMSAIEVADEMITVTNPELPALTDAFKLNKVADEVETHNLGVVVNRIKNEAYEFSIDGVKEFLNLPILGLVHEDKNVRKSIGNKEPVVTYKPGSKASREFRAIAETLIAGEYKKPKYSVGQRMLGWIK